MYSENIDISNNNGIIRGALTTPPDRINGCLICLHGGPGGDLHGNTQGFDQIAELAGNIKLATLQFSFYGNGKSEGNLEEYSISSQIEDYKSAVLYVKTKFKNTPIHIVGESAGATIASLNWIDEASSFVLLWPAFDLLNTDLKPFMNLETLEHLNENMLYERDGVKLGRQLVFEILTTDFSNSFILPDKPVFIAHGQADEEVPYGQSLRAIKSAKSNLMFLSHPTADHGFKSKESRAYLLRGLRSWLEGLTHDLA